MPKGKGGAEGKLGAAWRKAYGLPDEAEEQRGTYGWGKTPEGESMLPVKEEDYNAGWERAQKKLGEILNKPQPMPAAAPVEAKRKALESMLPKPEPVATPLAPEEAAYEEMRKRMHPGYVLTPEDEETIRKYNMMGQ